MAATPGVVDVVESKSRIVIPSVTIATLVADLVEMPARHPVAVTDVRKLLVKILETSPDRPCTILGQERGINTPALGIEMSIAVAHDLMRVKPRHSTVNSRLHAVVGLRQRHE